MQSLDEPGRAARRQPGWQQRPDERRVRLLDRDKVKHPDELARAELELVAGVDVVGVRGVASFAAVLVVKFVAEHASSLDDGFRGADGPASLHQRIHLP
jgi:hypothetical protein